MKKLIFLLFLLPFLAFGQTSATFQWKSMPTNDSVAYTFTGKPGGLSYIATTPYMRTYLYANAIRNLQSLTSPQSANGSINGTFFIADGSITGLSSSNARNVIAITTNPALDDNEHLFADNSIFIKTIAGRAIATYDAFTKINGTSNTNHAVSFQSRITYNNTGTISNLYDIDAANTVTAGTVTAMWNIFAQPIVSGGTVVKRVGLEAGNVALSGSGAVTTNIGLNIEDQTAGATNWSMIVGNAPSRYGGDVWHSNYSGSANTGANVYFTSGTSFIYEAKINHEIIASNQGNLHFNVRTASTAGDAGLTEVFGIYGGSTKYSLFTGGVRFPTTGFPFSNGTGSNATYYTSSGTGTVVALTASPTLTGTPILANAQVNGSLIYNAAAGNTMQVGSSTTSLTTFNDLNGSTFVPSLQENSATTAGIGALSNDGTNNLRASFVVNPTNWGLGLLNSAGGYVPFTIRAGATDWLKINTSGVVSIPNLTASRVTGTDASNNLVSYTLGTGLSLTGTTLSATGSGGTVTGGVINWPGTLYTTPTTGTGTTTLTFAPALATQTANTVLAGPTTGSAAAPTFRALVANDIPSLSSTYVTVGTSQTITGTKTFPLLIQIADAAVSGFVNQIGNVSTLTNNHIINFPDKAGTVAMTSDIPSQLFTQGHSIFTPTTGGTVATVVNKYNIINPAGTLATLTVNLPSSPSNNDTVYIKFTQAVTAVTYGNGTVVDGIASPIAGGLVILTYDTATTSWY